MANTTRSLDLYARIEDMLENKEAVETLYGYYYDTLSTLSFQTLLDVGCGSGAYLEALQSHFPSVRAKGIDLSPQMVSRTKQRGIEAEAVDLCDEKEHYDVITAVFDMVNYLPKDALERFFSCISDHLNAGGYFLFDLNTAYGFENVAVGAYVVEDKSRFLAIDSDYASGVYEAYFTLFEEEGSCYRKMQEKITQHYHTLEDILASTSLGFVFSEEIHLYGMDEADKMLILLQKAH